MRVSDSATPEGERITAIRALSEAGPPQTADQLLSLLDRREPETIEEAVLTAVGRFKDESLGTRLLARWPSLSAQAARPGDRRAGQPAGLDATVAESGRGPAGRS